VPIPKITQLTADGMATGGKAVARVEGKVVFVAGLAPGDRALVEITLEKGSYAEARVKGILKKGPNRIEPECGHFPRCGGCQWLHLSGPARLAEKQRQAQAQLRHFPELKWLEPDGASPDERRTRVRLHVKNGHLGYYSQGSRRLESISECPAMAPELAALLPALQKMVRFWHTDLQEIELIDDIQLDLDEGKKTALLIRLNKGDAAAAELLLQRIPSTIPVAGAAVAHSGGSRPLASRGSLDLAYQLSGPSQLLKINYSPFTFVQSSLPLNQRLVRRVMEFTGPPEKPGEPLVDLYCGVGNFSLPFAAAGFSVTGIESGELAIRSLEKNAAAAGLKLEARVGDGALPERLPMHALVVVDPPRTGAKGLATALMPFSPRKVVYVSCDSATLARDLKEFEGAGYKPEAARVLDLFPGTAHYETIVSLTPG
jgi:23S rRNA (uracil1939-C5)-methyltransferase